MWFSAALLPFTFLIFPLFPAVSNLHATNPEACQRENYKGKDEETGDGYPCGRRLGDDRERPFGHRHGRKRLKIVYDAYLFKHGREKEVYELPAVDQERRHNRITEEESYHDKDRTISYAGEHGDAQIS